MRRGLARALVGLPLLLFACTQAPSPDPSAGYPDGVDFPWSYTAPAGKITTLSLTPGENTLYFEPILAATNGYGPIEIDHSNGERQPGDGKTITLNGKTYARGFGTHAYSELRYSLKGTDGAQCSRFTVDVGVDDEVGNRGSVVFQVFLDNSKVYDSGTMTGASATKTVDLNIVGKGELRLVVTDAGDGKYYDHADWANPRIYCATQQPQVRMTLDQGAYTVFHMQKQALRVTFTSSDANFRGPVDLRLETADTDPEVLLTKWVDFSGKGPATRDVFIGTPDISLAEYTGGSTSPDGELIPPVPQAYRLVASVNGRDLADVGFSVLVKPLSISARFEPDDFSARVGTTVTLDLVMDISPAPTLPLSFKLDLSRLAGEFYGSLVEPDRVYGVEGSRMTFPVKVSLKGTAADLDPNSPVYHLAGVLMQGGDFSAYVFKGPFPLAASFSWQPLP